MKLIDFALEWKGRKSGDFSRHLRTIQNGKTKFNELPPAAKCTLAINDPLLYDLVISSLKAHSDLSAIPTILRTTFAQKPQDINFSVIESQVHMILTDVKPETSKAIQEESWKMNQLRQ